MGADFIEPDLVMTKDGFLVYDMNPCCLETNVSENSEFAKKNNENLDGKAVTDWFVSDFTLVSKTEANKTKQAFAERPNNTTINMQ
jgi:glycerophosphoryl diester phosphodiesterase